MSTPSRRFIQAQDAIAQAAEEKGRPAPAREEEADGARAPVPLL